MRDRGARNVVFADLGERIFSFYDLQKYGFSPHHLQHDLTFCDAFVLVPTEDSKAVGVGERGI